MFTCANSYNQYKDLYLFTLSHQHALLIQPHHTRTQTRTQIPATVLVLKQEVAAVRKQCGSSGYAHTTMPHLQQAASSEHCHPRL